MATKEEIQRAARAFEAELQRIAPALGEALDRMVDEDEATAAERVLTDLANATMDALHPTGVTSITSAADDDDDAVLPRRAIGHCPCVCSNGGFCGGCGHAGCGRR